MSLRFTAVFSWASVSVEAQNGALLADAVNRGLMVLFSGWSDRHYRSRSDGMAKADIVV